MKIVVTGCGEAFGRIARHTATRAEQMTGIEAVVLGDRELAQIQRTAERSVLEALRSPISLFKTRLFDLVDAQEILYWDADMIPLRPWNVRATCQNGFLYAVRDHWWAWGLPEDCARLGLPQEQYFNVGMMVLDRDLHAEWLRETEKDLPKLTDRRFHLQEQTVLSYTRWKMGVPVRWLDRRYNWVRFGLGHVCRDVDTVCGHIGNATSKGELLRYYDERRAEFWRGIYHPSGGATAALAGTYAYEFPGGVNGQMVLAPDGMVEGGSQTWARFWFADVQADGATSLILCEPLEATAELKRTAPDRWEGMRLSDGLGEHRMTMLAPYAEPSAPKESRTLTWYKQEIRRQGHVATFPVSVGSGRGLVMCAGGLPLLARAYICLAMLRELGCTLPAEVWHIGKGETVPVVMAELEKLGAKIVDSLEVAKTWPYRLSGWPIKPFAIAHSAFREVLYLDSDNFPLIDPTFLFETPQYAATGTILWPDVGRTPKEAPIWDITGVPWRDEPETESGQIVLDKARCARALSVCLWMNDQTEFYYAQFYGDKETFRYAWRSAGVPYAMPTRGIHSLPGVFCQHDFDGRRLFQHGTRAKCMLWGPKHEIPGFEKMDRFNHYLREIEMVLKRAGFGPAEMEELAPALRSEADVLISRAYKYDVPRKSSRLMTFLRDGTIGQGRGQYEVFWNFAMIDGAPRLRIMNHETLLLEAQSAEGGSWTGFWQVDDRPMAKLIPA